MKIKHWNISRKACDIILDNFIKIVGFTSRCLLLIKIKLKYNNYLKSYFKKVLQDIFLLILNRYITYVAYQLLSCVIKFSACILGMLFGCYSFAWNIILYHRNSLKESASYRYHIQVNLTVVCVKKCLCIY